eukprot:1160050-Pelagomonas_calceolata.AAC.11
MKQVTALYPNFRLKLKHEDEWSLKTEEHEKARGHRTGSTCSTCCVHCVGQGYAWHRLVQAKVAWNRKAARLKGGAGRS